jgi:hypothetical protein
VIGRRAFVIAATALMALRADAKKRALPPKAAFIHWPGHGHELHGFMAVDQKAHGPQPAVLVLGGQPEYAQAVTIWLGAAGFVACWPRSVALPDLQATARWLTTNAYATGKIGAVLLSAADVLPALASSLVCAVAVGPAIGPPDLPLLKLDRLAPDTPAGYVRATAFLKEHLR